jgi:hypothetical protein
MTQGFIFGQPVTRSGLLSKIVKDNLDAIGTLNAGATAPANPEEGMPWLDTSGSPTAFALKFYDGSAWQTIAEFPFATTATAIVRIAVNPAAQTWNLLHNLGKSTVTVTCFDLSGKVIDPLDIDISNVNQAVVQHAASIAGAALVFG